MRSHCRALALICLASATGGSPMAVWAAPTAFDHTHQAFDALLARRVKGGHVDYGGLAQDRAALGAYTQALGAVTGPQAATFTREQALAFWINAYNAFTLQLIVDRKPAKSIRDLDGAWDKNFFPVGGRSLSLNQIENEVIRPTYQEPRIHFVLVCAAVSCPLLESRAFTATDLEARLEAAARRFARDAQRNRVSQDGALLEVSSIFDWYGQDFVARYAKGRPAISAVRAFFAQALGRTIPESATVRFLPYDWRLNGTW